MDQPVLSRNEARWRTPNTQYMKYLKHTQKIISEFAWLIVIGTSVIFAIGAILLSRTLPPRYQASVAYTIDHRTLQKSEDYGYDGYYALRAQEIFADTVVSWFRTPAVIEQVKKLASDHTESGIPSRLDYRVKKFSGQNVVVNLMDSDKDRLHVLALTTTGVITSKASELNKSGGENQSLFAVTASAPIISEKTFSPVQSGLIGLLLGAILAGITIFLITPTKK